MKPEIAERIRRPSPGGHVIEGSLPVISFGDPDVARVATISLNPSNIEFKDDRGWLLDERRRLHSLVSLERHNPQDLTDDEVRAVIQACRDYFEGNWHRRWFGSLERLLVASQAGSYLDGSACHLDLVQWATDPVQAELPADEWAALVQADLPFLRWQLDNSEVDIVLVNGGGVVKGIQQAGLVDRVESDFLELPQGGRRLRIDRAVADGRLFLGWSIPVARPIPTALRKQLASWLADQIADWTAPTPAPALQTGTAPEYLAAGTTVPLEELVSLLSDWTARSRASTIGDVGSFGGRALVTVTTSAASFVLNADTKRSAVLEFLSAAQRGEVVFRVIANRRGRINRVAFRADEQPTPGWYAYTQHDWGEEGTL